MKTRVIIIMMGMLVLIMPACLPTDENVNPDDPVAKFLGDWKVNESCRRLNYNVEIQADPGNSAQVLIYNYGNTGPGYDPAVGLVVTNSVHVSSQTIGEGWTVSGKGTYQVDGTISWDYTLIIGPSEFSCNALFSK
ncbi:MAG: hypothetical protein M0Q51_11690 [Bacteroidales bacterium]|nr:hypothetical protein [Bacteroidales bacterium]